MAQGHDQVSFRDQLFAKQTYSHVVGGGEVNGGRSGPVSALYDGDAEKIIAVYNHL